MRNRDAGRRLGLGALIAGLLAASPAHARDEKSAIIVHASVVTMDEADTILHDATILVENGRIKRILPADAPLGGSEGPTIDAKGQWLVPGLVDAHTHYDVDNELKSYLRHGVTTILSLGRPAEAMKPFPAIAAAIASGAFPGPKIYATGPIIANSVKIDTPAQARSFVAEQAAQGYGFIKLYNGTTQPVFDAAVAEARKRGMGVFGHMPRGIAPGYAVSRGLNVIAHMEELFFTSMKGPTDAGLDALTPDWKPDMSTIDGVLDQIRDHDGAIIPNLVASYGFFQLWADPDSIFASPEMARLDPESAQGWRTGHFATRPNIEKRMLRERLKFPLILDMTWRAKQKGVLLVAGTDSPIPPMFPGGSLHEELRLLVAAGLTPTEALATATRNAGALVRKYVDRDACIGVIKAGCEADLLLLSADPTKDIRATGAIVGVMSDGRWRTREVLDRP